MTEVQRKLAVLNRAREQSNGEDKRLEPASYPATYCQIRKLVDDAILQVTMMHITKIHA